MEKSLFRNHSLGTLIYCETLKRLIIINSVNYFKQKSESGTYKQLADAILAHPENRLSTDFARPEKLAPLARTGKYAFLNVQIQLFHAQIIFC